MVKVIMGLKGTGKTKQLIEAINRAVDTEPGNIVCIEKKDNLRFDISHRVRLVESNEYKIDSFDFLKAFICGLHAGNFDITHIFIDGVYKIAASNSLEDAEKFLNWCEKFGAENSISFTVTLSEDIANATENLKRFF
ncbi:MAG: hypothetical protein J6P31_02255 [Oscillospiraceae bacterium]|nr:hypothetical protein [Oscillospiraceae bacterium]